MHETNPFYDETRKFMQIMCWFTLTMFVVDGTSGKGLQIVVSTANGSSIVDVTADATVGNLVYAAIKRTRMVGPAAMWFKGNVLEDLDQLLGEADIGGDSIVELKPMVMVSVNVYFILHGQERKFETKVAASTIKQFVWNLRSEVRTMFEMEGVQDAENAFRIGTEHSMMHVRLRDYGIPMELEEWTELTDPHLWGTGSKLVQFLVRPKES